MAQEDWLDMLDKRQQLHHFARAFLTQTGGGGLTNSELEVLTLIYLEPEACTPLGVSRRGGMKKEAVSRTLKQLLERELVSRQKNPRDERSYVLSLTGAGREALEACYRPILQPLYELRRSMGADFDTLFGLIGRANREIQAES